jgi:GNAT superfamily N-acetyltransferase
MKFQIPNNTQSLIPNFAIRKAEKQDAKLILDFITQLAIYEKMLDDVVSTEESLSNYLFGDTPFAYVLIGEYHNQPVGFALFFTNFSTFLGRPGIFLEDLFVLPEFRGKGFGKTLLAFLAKLAVNNNFGRVEWTVLNWNTPAIDVYKSLGAKQMDEWSIFRLTGDNMIDLSKFV